MAPRSQRVLAEPAPHYVADHMIDARPQTGTAPDEQTAMRYPTRASELDHRRLQVPPSPLHDPSPKQLHAGARGERLSRAHNCLTKDIRVSGLALDRMRGVGHGRHLRQLVERVKANALYAAQHPPPGHARFRFREGTRGDRRFQDGAAAGFEIPQSLPEAGALSPAAAHGGHRQRFYTMSRSAARRSITR